MAIELDAEQIRNLRKDGLTPEDCIDFPCSPIWASFYASQGLTRDYPPEYYQVSSGASLQRQITKLNVRVKKLESSKTSKSSKPHSSNPSFRDLTGIH